MISRRTIAILLGTSLVSPRTLLAQPPAAVSSTKMQGIPRFLNQYPLDGIAWNPPSTAHPQGTLLLAYAQKLSSVLIEWDIKNPENSRRIFLESGGPAYVRIARRGASVIAVVSNRIKRITWEFFSPDLKRKRKGDMGPGKVATVVSSSSETFLAWLSLDEKNLILARLDPESGKVTARRELPLGEEVKRSTGEYACNLLLSGDRLFLAVKTTSRSRLMSLSLDLQDVVERDLQNPAALDGPGPEGLLFEAPGPMLAIHRGSHIEWYPLNAQLALPPHGRQLEWAPLRWFQATFDAARGLALSDGSVFPPGAEEPRAQEPHLPMVYRIFWGHGKLFWLTLNEKGYGAYLSWDETGP